jgi:glycosyltransferase involved in cell wall biosynthesis
MNSRPTISVIVPTYNRVESLVPVLEAIFNQTYPPAEVIVADNGSTDETLNMLYKLEALNLKVLELPASGLPAIARNAGIHQAIGDFIAFCDSDDVWLPEKLAKQVENLTDETRGVCSNALLKSDKSLTYFEKMPKQLGTAQLLQQNWVMTSTVLVQKDLLKNVGGFPTTQRLRLVEDYVTWLRLSVFTNFTVIQEPLITYDDNSSDSHRNELETQGLLMAPLAWLDFLAWMRQRGEPLTLSENLINVALPRAIAANFKLSAKN